MQGLEEPEEFSQISQSSCESEQDAEEEEEEKKEEEEEKCYEQLEP